MAFLKTDKNRKAGNKINIKKKEIKIKGPQPITNNERTKRLK